jgi:hypothetical protein
MPLKNVEKANPNLKQWWFEIMDTGCVAQSLTAKQAASIRTQLGRYRTLCAQQIPEFFEMIRYIQLTTYPDPNDLNRVIIYGEKTQRIDPATLQRVIQTNSTPARVLTPAPQPAYDPSEHHHNPVQVTTTGIPMQMPEVLPESKFLTDAERRAIESAEERRRNEELLKSLGFDKPPQRNEE